MGGGQEGRREGWGGGGEGKGKKGVEDRKGEGMTREDWERRGGRRVRVRGRRYDTSSL